MVLVNKHTQMGVFMKVIGLKLRKMGMANINILMVVTIMGNGRMD